MTGKVRLICSCIVLFLSGCSTPATITPPTNAANRSLPPPQPARQLIHGGDTLRIVRNAESQPAGNSPLFVVGTDGELPYPEAGVIQAAGLTPEALAEKIGTRLKNIYRQPDVSVNVANSPGNRIFVGGEVRTPAAYPLDDQTSLEQALLSAGGILPTADAKRVSLLRHTGRDHYQTYVFDLSQLPDGAQGSVQRITLQRGDLVFVPKSGIGNTVEAVDLYFTRLFPINKGIGIGLNYDLNRETVSNSGNTQNTYNLNGTATP